MKEEIKYYQVNDDFIFRTRESDEAYYIEKLIDGQWIDDADLLKYLFNGEPGADEISAAEAERLTKQHKAKRDD